MDIWLIEADGEVIDAAVNERMALAAAEGVARAGLVPTIWQARVEEVSRGERDSTPRGT